MYRGISKKAALPLFLAPLAAKAGAVSAALAPAVARFGRPVAQTIGRVGAAGTQHLLNSVNRAYQMGANKVAATSPKYLRTLGGTANIAKSAIFNYATKFPYDYPYIKQSIDAIPGGFFRGAAKVGAGALGAPYILADKIADYGMSLYDNHLQNKFTHRAAPNEYELAKAQYFSDLARRNNGLPVHKSKYSGTYNPVIDAYNNTMSINAR